MKKAAFLLMAGLLSGSAFGAAITVTNNVGSDNVADYTLLADATGAGLTGWGAIGTFSITNDQISALGKTADFAGVLKGFTQVGNTFNISGAVWDGLVNGAVGAELAGKGVYAVIGNGTSLAGATNLAVFQPANVTFVADPGATPDVIIQIGKGTTLVGGEKVGSLQIAGQNSTNVLRLAGVPEPSSALLLLTGAMVFFRRRK